ncbi:hypothetical protein A3SI_09318 [Nitritalea halalkaliphila LW7]|uniref:SH3b domain-containing protein n=1 Tax=Nitritalea halalkaliphila LW7 TaxID=1189621 RepID=I5C4A1_9BACT|nr:SH3 domain-containing protein [Nitritalea halalkaliphila]EIM76653.1 hypothetical protein A3SI_09318 [Nitritalea halalkaliphila LW7]
MQNLKPFFILFFLLFFSKNTQNANAQEITISLEQADAFFAAQDYQEAMEVYEVLLHEQGKFSPAMLLKMAFIAEGRGDLSAASFYLAKYYAHNNSPRVVSKIKLINGQENLRGFTVSDKEQLLSLLLLYKEPLLGALSLLVIVFLILALLKPARAREAAFPALVFCLLALALNNGLQDPKYALIDRMPTLLMEGPSGGSRLVEKLETGHRVQVVGETDNWLRVELENETGYIRKSSLRML